VNGAFAEQVFGCLLGFGAKSPGETHCGYLAEVSAFHVFNHTPRVILEGHDAFDVGEQDFVARDRDVEEGRVRVSRPLGVVEFNQRGVGAVDGNEVARGQVLGSIGHEAYLHAGDEFDGDGPFADKGLEPAESVMENRGAASVQDGQRVGSGDDPGDTSLR